MIQDFSITKNAYKVVGILPGGFMGSIDIGMTDDLKTVLMKLNNLSGAVQTQFLPLWLLNNQVEMQKNNEEKKEEVSKPTGTEDSSTVIKVGD
jgi:hypothetical protein